MTRIRIRRWTVVVALAVALTGCSAPTGPGAAGGPAAGATWSPGAGAATPTAGAPSTSTTPTLRPTPKPAPPRTTPATTPVAHFGTRPPGSALPSGAQCAAWVRTRTYPENKGVNRTANATTGHRLASGFFGGDDARAGTTIAPRVDGQFTGTTRQILRWAACKWGIDEDLVYAQAAVESWWRQDTLGDWTGDASICAPGRGFGVDGRSDQCPGSFGILQNRYQYEKGGWPGIASSTAMNADLAYAIWRVCFEGYEGWLNTVEQGRHYAAGDAWGCVGRWFSGRWYVNTADYLAKVHGYLDQRIWEIPDFQQP